MLPFVAVGGKDLFNDVLIDSTPMILARRRLRNVSRRRMKLCVRVKRNVIGPMKRDSLPMFMSESAETAVDRITDAQRRLSICLASFEKG